jgi:integrase
VKHWLDWCVYEGDIETNPFASVRFETKVRYHPYAVPTNDEVRAILGRDDQHIGQVLLVCLLTGMRAGEALGLLSEDLVAKGNLGRFFYVRPNELRLLKTDAAERQVPVHSMLDTVLDQLPKAGPLFPDLTVREVTKRFRNVVGCQSRQRLRQSPSGRSTQIHRKILGRALPVLYRWPYRDGQQRSRANNTSH